MTAMDAEIMENWEATGTLKGVEVMMVPGALRGPDGSNRSFPTYLDKDGNVHHVHKGAKYDAYPRERYFVEPVDPIEDAYQRGLRDAAGLETTKAEAANRKLFRVQDIAPAIMCCLGAHMGIPWVFGPDNCEGELMGRNDDGSYEVITRIYDWKEKRHFSYRLRLPERMELEVIPHVPPGG